MLPPQLIDLNNLNVGIPPFSLSLSLLHHKHPSECSITFAGIMSALPSTARDRAIHFYQGLNPGPSKPGEATEAYKEIDELAYALSRAPAFTSRPLKIIAIGAGFSGLAIARAIHVGKLPNASISVYEKNAGIGGT